MSAGNYYSFTDHGHGNDHQSDAVELSSFWNLFQKKWVVALLLTLLVIESMILIVIMVEWSLGNQNFPTVSLDPPVKVNCTTLTARTFAENSQNRTTVFFCAPGFPAAAISAWSPLTIRSAHGLPSGIAIPTFTLPPGYLNLSITPESLFDCSYQYRTPLKSGQAVFLNGDYVYCGVTSLSSSPVMSFNIKWIPAPPKPTGSLPWPLLGGIAAFSGMLTLLDKDENPPSSNPAPS